MLPVFTSKHIHRDAMAALLTLRRAVEKRKATAELVDRTMKFFDAALRKPPRQRGKV